MVHTYLIFSLCEALVILWLVNIARITQTNMTALICNITVSLLLQEYRNHDKKGKGTLSVRVLALENQTLMTYTSV